MPSSKSLIIAATSLASASALIGPAAAPPRPSMPIVSGEPHLASSSSGSIVARSGRRQFMASLAAGAAALTALPTAGHASYALYAASLDTITERKASGDWQKSIGTDTTALQEIQAGIARKRPTYSQKAATKVPQYCAGQTSAVSPMMENRCVNIGVSKADQSNAMADSYGNMNVGAYTSLSAEDKARAERRQALIREAADNARLRQQMKTQ